MAGTIEMEGDDARHGDIEDVQDLEEGGDHDALFGLPLGSEPQGALNDELIGAPEKEIVQQHAGEED